MPFDTFFYWITDAYAPFLVDDNPGDLSDEEIRTLKEFDADQTPSAYLFKTWIDQCDDYGEQIHSYRRCEVTGLTARCLKMRLDVRIPKTPV